jgi:hypothetical protein
VEDFFNASGMLMSLIFAVGLPVSRWGPIHNKDPAKGSCWAIACSISYFGLRCSGARLLGDRFGPVRAERSALWYPPPVQKQTVLGGNNL